MNKLLLLVTLSVLLGACTTVGNNNNLPVLDLTADKTAVDEYWIAYRKVASQYPQTAKNEKLSGCVKFAVTINTSGRADDVNIIKSFPEGVFDQQASIAVQKWVWVPTQSNPERQPVLTTIQQDFVVRQPANSKAAYDACKD